eukprot:2897132-Pyramimonas_sp.AAC.1
MIPPASAPSLPRAPGQAQGHDEPRAPSEEECWRPEMQLLRRSLPVLWIDVAQQVAPQIADAYCHQHWDHLRVFSSSVEAVAQTN